MAEKSERRLQALLGHLRPASGPLVPGSVSGSGLDLAAGYRYTLSGNGLLNEEQRAAYERDGFLVVRGLVGKEDLEKYRDRFRDICTGAVKVL